VRGARSPAPPSWRRPKPNLDAWDPHPSGLRGVAWPGRVPDRLRAWSPRWSRWSVGEVQRCILTCSESSSVRSESRFRGGVRRVAEPGTRSLTGRPHCPRASANMPDEPGGSASRQAYYHGAGSRTRRERRERIRSSKPWAGGANPPRHATLHRHQYPRYHLQSHRDASGARLLASFASRFDSYEGRTVSGELPCGGAHLTAQGNGPMGPEPGRD
jgi:hypothetical protein